MLFDDAQGPAWPVRWSQVTEIGEVWTNAYSPGDEDPTPVLSAYHLRLADGGLLRSRAPSRTCKIPTARWASCSGAWRPTPSGRPCRGSSPSTRSSPRTRGRPEYLTDKVRAVPELPEVESARAVIERARAGPADRRRGRLRHLRVPAAPAGRDPAGPARAAADGRPPARQEHVVRHLRRRPRHDARAGPRHPPRHVRQDRHRRRPGHEIDGGDYWERGRAPGDYRYHGSRCPSPTAAR